MVHELRSGVGGHVPLSGPLPGGGRYHQTHLDRGAGSCGPWDPLKWSAASRAEACLDIMTHMPPCRYTAQWSSRRTRQILASMACWF